MASEILINVRPSETRVALIEKGILVDFMIDSNRKKGLAGSLYRGKVSRILPGMQAAFVDIGLDRAAFLYVGDVGPAPTEGAAFVLDTEANEDSNEENGRKDSSQESTQKPQIQDLLKEGEEILVQVAKDPLGTKGARITTHISLPGRYVVFLPTLQHLGISRRIEDETERQRLKEILEKSKPAAGGVIVRTAGEGASEERIKADIDYLTLLWDDILKNYKKKKGNLVYTELDVELRAVRDLLTEDVTRIVIDDAETHRKVLRFCNQFLPRHKVRVQNYDGDIPLFDQYDIDLELSRALERKVWLKSGGYIIVDEAEALVVIDVNTGSFVGKKDLEDTILKTNLEAVREIAHQLRIRNCGGIIIIDFIDMEKEANREKVVNALKEELKKDRAKTNASNMSGLGLVEMTRKRIRPSLMKTLCEPCSYCNGRGFVKTKVSVANEIFKQVERDRRLGRNGSVVIRCHPDVASWIYDEETDMLEYLEQKLNVRLVFKTESNFHIEQFQLDPEGIDALV